MASASGLCDKGFRGTARRLKLNNHQLKLVVFRNTKGFRGTARRLKLNNHQLFRRCAKIPSTPAGRHICRKGLAGIRTPAGCHILFSNRPICFKAAAFS